MHGVLRRLILQIAAITLFASSLGTVSPVITETGSESAILREFQGVGHGDQIPVNLELAVRGTVHVNNLPPSVGLEVLRIGGKQARVFVLPSDPNTLFDIRHVEVRVSEPSGASRCLKIEFHRSRALVTCCDFAAAQISLGEISFDLDLNEAGCYVVDCVVADESHAVRSWVSIQA